MAEQRWRVRVGAAAELDFANILKWTTENFGARQSRIYRNTLVQAIGELADGPMLRGRRPATRSCPVFARSTLRGTVVVEVTSSFTAQRPGARSKFLRILHDRMDLQRHVPIAPDGH